MTYQRFEDTPAWQAAMALANGVYDVVKDRGFNGQGDLRDQLQRASLSVSNNIAEGFERGSSNELIQFLYYARGSAGEVRSALWFASGRPEIAHLKSRISDLISRAESVSRQIRGWANSAQNSDIKGQRHLTDQGLADYQQKQRATAFLQKLQEIRDRHQKPPEPESGI